MTYAGDVRDAGALQAAAARVHGRARRARPRDRERRRVARHADASTPRTCRPSARCSRPTCSGMVHTFQPFVARDARARARGTLAGIASVAGLSRHSRARVRTRRRRRRRSRTSRACASRCAGSGVRVVTICPGYVATPLTARNPYRHAVHPAPDVAAARIARALAAPAPLCGRAVADGGRRAPAAHPAAAAVRPRVPQRAAQAARARLAGVHGMGGDGRRRATPRGDTATATPAWNEREGAVARRRTRLGRRRASAGRRGAAHRVPRAEHHRAAVRARARRPRGRAHRLLRASARRRARGAEVRRHQGSRMSSALRALAPTHLIVNVDENRREVVDVLARFVPHVIVTHPQCARRQPPPVRADRRDLRRATPRRPRSCSVTTRARDRRSTARSRRWPRERVLYLIWRNPWMTVRADTYVGTTLAAAGWDVVATADDAPLSGARCRCAGVARGRPHPAVDRALRVHAPRRRRASG